MKVYCFYTTAYDDLVDGWFGPSAAMEYEVVARRDPDPHPVEYKQTGWRSITRRKVDFILEAVKDNPDQPFVFSDPDVQFLGPTHDLLLRVMRNRDLLFQQDCPLPHWLCTGFFVCRGNARTLNFWHAVRVQMDATEDDSDDQDCARGLLVDPLIDKIQRRIHDPGRAQLRATRLSQHRLNPFGIRWDYLPGEFFGGGTLTGVHWHPGMELPVPAHALVHHANFTIGLANKLAQLHYVSEVAARRRLPGGDIQV